jgi:hypothetical protein
MLFSGESARPAAATKMRSRTRDGAKKAAKGAFEFYGIVLKSPGIRSSRWSSRHRAFASVFRLALSRKSCGKTTILDDIPEDRDFRATDPGLRSTSDPA